VVAGAMTLAAGTEQLRQMHGDFDVTTLNVVQC